MPRPQKIVLTGAPGSGKSTISRELERRHPGKFVVVPEAATQVYLALGRKWNELTLDERRDAQRRMYELQLKQEAETAARYPGQAMLLDRGTIDGAAYWPDGEAAFYREFDTTEATEFARYDHILVLETAAAIGIYDGDASNEIRFEGAAEAIENSRKLAALWARHDKVTLVRAERDLKRKIDVVSEIVLASLI